MPTVKAIIEQVESEKRSETAAKKPRRIKPLGDLPAPKNEDLLTWYFQEGQSAFERSTMGSMIDMAMLYDYVSVRCRDCHGTGIVGDIDAVRRVTLKGRRLKQGSGKGKRSEERSILWQAIGEVFADCPECSGTGRRSYFRGDWRPIFSKEPPFEPLNEIDVQFAADGSFSGKGAPDDTVLTRYAVASRRLLLLPIAYQQALAAAWGAEGESWATDRRGREWAVIPCTVAGKELLRADPGLHPDKNRGERIRVIAELEELHPDPKRTGMLTRSIRQAHDTLGRAIVAWNAVSGEDL